MPTIFDLVKSQEVVSYWNEVTIGRPPFLGEELLTATKQLDDTVRFIKGSSGAPVQLKLSAYDAKAVPRERIGFSTVLSDMPFFKESMYVDEKLQKELNRVLATGNQAYIDSVMNRIFKDSTRLLEAARVTREIMVWQALTTGAISLASNGQSYTLDYGVVSGHKPTVTKSWSDTTADIIGDVRTYADTCEDDTGVRPSRLVVSRATFNKITANDKIKKTVFSAANVDAYLSEAKAKEFFLMELGVDIAVYDKRYQNAAGSAVKFVPDDMAILLPAEKLGEMTFGETPEECNLMAGIEADVTIADLGVAVTAIKIADPVTVETKVSQVCAPSLPNIDKVMMIDITTA